MANYVAFELIKLLGTEYVQGKRGLDYGNWSPNNVRGIHITTREIIVEYFVPYKGKRFHSRPLNQDILLKQSLQHSDKLKRGVKRGINHPFEFLLETKEYQNLEEISIHAALVNVDGMQNLIQQGNPGMPNLLYPKMVPDIGERYSPRRLRIFALDNTGQANCKVLESLREEDKETPLIIQRSAKGGENFAMIRFPADKDGEWKKRIGLAPIFYPLDRVGMPLVKELKSFAGSGEVQIKRPGAAGGSKNQSGR